MLFSPVFCFAPFGRAPVGFRGSCLAPPSCALSLAFFVFRRLVLAVRCSEVFFFANRTVLGRAVLCSAIFCYIDLLSALLCASLLYAISLCFVFLTLYTISVFCALRSWAFRRFLLYYALFESLPDFSGVYIRNCFSCLFFLLFYLCLSSFFTWWYGARCIQKMRYTVNNS